MKEVKVESSFFVYDDLSNVSSEVQELMSKASEARDNAYAPYSKFHVGAAILLDNGEVITGNNQENASYPSGLCAERTAIYYSGAKFPNSKILKMAIIAGSTKNTTSKPIPPCGACRQVIWEICGEIPIYICNDKTLVTTIKSSTLLPSPFNDKYLK